MIDDIDYLSEKDFLYIYENLKEKKVVAFDFCPNDYSRFGVVLSLVFRHAKLTKSFSGIHNVLSSFLFISISRVGSFGFSFHDKEFISKDYISEKLNLRGSDIDGFYDLINYIKEEINE